MNIETAILIFAVYYAVCAIVVYGAILAYWQRKYPELAFDHFYRDRAFALESAVLSPIIIIIVPFSTSWFYHGFMFRNPHKSRE